jgi:hypothetical protein
LPPSLAVSAKDFGGLAVDARSKLRDGTEFEGIDGLRDYLAGREEGTRVGLDNLDAELKREPVRA